MISFFILPKICYFLFEQLSVLPIALQKDSLLSKPAEGVNKSFSPLSLIDSILPIYK